MNDSAIARRYAKSFFILGAENNTLERFANDISYVSDVYKSQEDLRWVFENPVFAKSKKTSIVDQVFRKDLHEHTISFLHLIIQKGREAMLPDMVRAFQSMYREHENIQDAKLVFANEMDQPIVDNIKQILHQQSGKTIELETSTDESLIGGFVLRLGDRQLDTSVKGKLNEIRKQIQN